MRMMPKKVIDTYNKCEGKIFTRSDHYMRFTDQNGCTDYNYRHMLWLITNRYMIGEYNPDRFVIEFKLRV